MARMWNSCASAIDGWPLQRLAEPPIKAKAGPAWEDFAEGLRRDVDACLDRLTKPRRGLGGRRIRPCQPATIRTRRAQLAAVARMAVRLGVPIETLNSLAALLQPAVIEPVIEAYWRKDGDEPKVYTIDLGWRLLTIARETGGLDKAAIDRLDEIRATLEDYRRSGLTPKNLQLVRQVLTEGVWSEVVSLPTVLMQQARSTNDHAPIKAAVTAQLAVALAILTFAPIRISNLVGIQLGENLIKPGGLNTPYWLVFPHYDVKNRVDLNFQFDQPLTDLIDEYVHEFRPALLRGANTPWLFPGEGGEPKTTNTLGRSLPSGFKRQWAFGSRCTNSDTQRRRSTSSTGRVIMRRYGGCLDTGVSRRRSPSTAACRPRRRPSSSEKSSVSRSNSIPLPREETYVTAASNGARPANAKVRSLPLDLWPDADRNAWNTACRPATRLKRGGLAGHLKPVTRDDLARRYGYFLDFLDRRGLLQSKEQTAANVTVDNVDAYIAELNDRVGSVTVYGSISKLRRAARFIAPGRDFTWLADIERDLALVMRPRSKFDRMVMTEVLVEAGLTLIHEAESSPNLSELARACQVRNGLMVALLALCPIRRKNFVTLEIGRSFIQIHGTWWIVLSAAETKENRPDERPVDSSSRLSLTATSANTDRRWRGQTTCLQPSGSLQPTARP